MKFGLSIFLFGLHIMVGKNTHRAACCRCGVCCIGALSVMTVDVETGREHLTAKTMSAFDHLYEHHRDEADWFLKVGFSSVSYTHLTLPTKRIV